MKNLLLSSAFENMTDATDADVLAAIREVPLDEGELTVSMSKVAERKRDGENLAEALDQVSDRAEHAAEDNNVSVSAESMQFALQTLLSSRGVRAPSVCLESHRGEAGTLRAVAETARTSAQSVRDSIKVAMESDFDTITKEIENTTATVERARNVISSGIQRVKAKEALLKDNVIELNHFEIHKFLHYNGAPVLSLTGVMHRELENMRTLLAVVEHFSGTYEALTKLAKDMVSGDINSLRKFVRELLVFESEDTLRRLSGMQLLNNGRLYMTTSDGALDPDHEFDEYPVLESEYRLPTHDGSKAPLMARARAGGLRSAAMAAGGALVGSMFGIPGILIGAVGGGLAGGLAGAQALNQKYQGSNTNSATPFNATMDFMKDALAVVDLIKDFDREAQRGYSNYKRMDSHFNSLLGLISGDSKRSTSAEVVKVLAALNGVQAADAFDAERYRQLVINRTNAMYMAYVSVIEVSIEHLRIVADGTLKVIEGILVKTQA